MDMSQGDKPGCQGTVQILAESLNSGVQQPCDHTESESILAFADQAGRLLIRTLVWLVLGLLAVQLLLRLDAVRMLISPLYRMEGKPVDARRVKDWQEIKEGSFLHNYR